MAVHARSGGSIEIMGVMTGKIKGNEFIVMDVFPLPVEGTETRVNAMGQAYEYMVQFDTINKKIGRMENIVGWYHSHPGYGCWLSGIDVGTQKQNQQFQDPFLALVVDPNRTISAGKVDIGAFRTYPESQKKAATKSEEYQTIPSDKLADFGVHANEYYKLEISYFKSSLDAKLLELLWNKYWVSTLSHSSLVANHDYAIQQIRDIALKTAKASEILSQSAALNHNHSHSRGSHGNSQYQLLAHSAALIRKGGPATHNSAEIKAVSESVADGVKMGNEQLQGLISREIRDQLFSNISGH